MAIGFGHERENRQELACYCSLLANRGHDHSARRARLTFIHHIRPASHHITWHWHWHAMMAVVENSPRRHGINREPAAA